jgi:hypothetical protein
VLIPGGGLDENGEPAPWVKSRLDLGLTIEGDPLLVLLSGGTTYKPPPLDERGFPIVESVSSARYLMRQGIPPERILIDTWSLDTIGNAFFARVVHCEPRALKHLLVITSDFHMRRTRAIFEWVFSLQPRPVQFQLTFEAVRDIGMSPEALRARLEKEEKSLDDLALTTKRITSMELLHEFLFKDHGAYSMKQSQRSSGAGAEWIGTY